jgi:SAM-dependent methyltransferase
MAADASPARGDVDYEAHGEGYARRRRADPRIAAVVRAALGEARRVVNVGAGAGSYEPADLQVVAVEPSAAMRAQRPEGAAPVVDGVAEALPFADGAFDAAMAMVTVHQWPDLRRGLAELRRVSRGPVVILTADGEALHRFWLGEYVPELFVVERRRYPPMEKLRAGLGGRCEVREIAVPIDCIDGFTEAFYARPEALLDPATRRGQSAWGFVDDAAVERGIDRLGADLESGAWDARYGDLRSRPEFVGSLRLVVGLAPSVTRTP